MGRLARNEILQKEVIYAKQKRNFDILGVAKNILKGGSRI